MSISRKEQQENSYKTRKWYIVNQNSVLIRKLNSSLKSLFSQNKLTSYFEVFKVLDTNLMGSIELDRCVEVTATFFVLNEVVIINILSVFVLPINKMESFDVLIY